MQDTKCVIIVDEKLPLGVIANTAAVLSLTIGRTIESITVGPDVCDASGNAHRGITTVPIPILKSTADKIKLIREEISQTDEVVLVDFNSAAPRTTTYEEYTKKINATLKDNLEYLGIVLFGNKKIVNKYTGNLPLLR